MSQKLNYDKKRMKQKMYNHIINQISEIRRNNNIEWMEILKLAFESNPEKAKIIFKQITKNDKDINKLSKELCK